MNTVAIVGAGLVGCSWSVVFALGGSEVRVFDDRAEARDRVLDRVRRTLGDMRAGGLIDDVEPVVARVGVFESLGAALAGADYVQESVFERVDVKTEIAAEIGASITGDTVVGSSSSGIPSSVFTETAPHRERFLIVHPVNPPHLVPVVELVPAPWTDRAIVPWLRDRMSALGMVPVVVRREVEGFILNRLQGALLNEAWALFEEGYASAADIDATVSHGLGLRWAFMGPFETIDLNAPGGVADYAERFGPLYNAIARSRMTPRPWSDALIAKIAAERRAALPLEDLQDRSDWRDRRLTRLVAHLRAAEGSD